MVFYIFYVSDTTGFGIIINGAGEGNDTYSKPHFFSWNFIIKVFHGVIDTLETFSAKRRQREV